jgi:hypothetical protein
MYGGASAGEILNVDLQEYFTSKLAMVVMSAWSLAYVMAAIIRRELPNGFRTCNNYSILQKV